MSQEIERTVKTLPFIPGKSNWSVWSSQFLARAFSKGSRDVLLGNEVPPDESEVIMETDPHREEKLRKRKANTQAYQDLMLCFSDLVNFTLIKSSITVQLPNGDAALAWKKLMNKHEPTTTANKSTLIQKFYDSKLTKVEKDPDEWISKLELLQAKLMVMNHEITDDQLVVHVIHSVYPNEYDAIMDQLQNEFDFGSEKPNLNTVKDRLRNKFNRIKRKNKSTKDGDDSDDEETEESALYAGGKYKGQCTHCGKWGHKAVDCRDKNKPKSTNTDTKTDDGNKPRFSGKCYYCGKMGHRSSECRKKEKDKGGDESANTVKEGNKKKDDETMLIVCEECNVASITYRGNMWIGDTGATSNMTNTLDGVTDLEDIDINVKMGDGRKVKATKKGMFRGVVKQNDGKTANVAFEVKYVPDLHCNLMSITTALKNGAKLSNEGEVIVLTKNGTTVKFDKKSKAGDGNTMSVCIEPKKTKKNENLPEEANAASTNLNRKAMDINDMHRLLGHMGDAKVKIMAKHMGIKLTGKAIECEHCDLAKAKRKKIAKDNEEKTNIPGERLYIDISLIKSKSAGGKKHWLLVVDEATDMKFSIFMKKKSHLPGEMMKLLEELRVKGKPVRFIRLDNAGENKSFQERAKKNKHTCEIQFEFTAPGTPQQNGVVERAFPTLMGRVRAMMNQAGFTRAVRQLMWAECVRTATMVENSTRDKVDQGAPIELLYGVKPTWLNELRTFGEIAVLAKNTQGFLDKLDDRGRTCMFVGYSDDHPKGTYRFVHLSTKRIVHSRDSKWLKKTWGEYRNVKAEPVITDDDEITVYSYSDSVPEIEEVSENEEIEGNVPEGTEQGGSTKLERELNKLNTFYNPVNLRKDEEAAECAFVTATESDPSEPRNFQEAWNHPDPKIRELWRAAIKKEFHDMIKRGVWRYCKKRDVPSDRKLIGCKWVFKAKKNGVYRARLVALGYSQIPGVDFTDNFAPVINDITFRILLILYLTKKYDSRIIDVETAFLHGDLEEQIFMKIPDGLREVINVADDDCCELQKSMYGLVQAARQWWKQFVTYLESMGFCKSIIDPCLLYRKNQKGIVYLGLYVDDVLMIGDTAAIQDAVTDIKSRYDIKEIGKMYEYVGCTVVPDQEKLYIIQPDLIKKLATVYGEDVSKLQKYATPAAPGESVVRPTSEEHMISEEEQRTYRSGVGMLLYLVKHSRPDISNAVRELAKVMDGATCGQLKSMYRTIKYVIDTKNVCLALTPNRSETKEWVLYGMSDSDYAGDKDSRISVSGYVLYANGALVTWKSRGQKSVTLSSTEAEYVALAELVTEVMFVKMILESMGMSVQIPIKLRADNIGALFLAKNTTTGQRTKHIDVRYHFIRELIEEGTIEVEFVKTQDNEADIYTKNTSGDLFKKHTNGYMKEIEYDYENSG